MAQPETNTMQLIAIALELNRMLASGIITQDEYNAQMLALEERYNALNPRDDV